MAAFRDNKQVLCRIFHCVLRTTNLRQNNITITENISQNCYTI